MREHGNNKNRMNFMDEILRSRTEITIETLSVTTIKKREAEQPTAYCHNCGHPVTTLDPKLTRPIKGICSTAVAEAGSQAKNGELR